MSGRGGAARPRQATRASSQPRLDHRSTGEGGRRGAMAAWGRAPQGLLSGARLSGPPDGVASGDWATACFPTHCPAVSRTG